MPDSTPPPPAPEPAPRQPAPDGPTGRDRLLAALKRPGRAQVGVAVLLAVVGFAAITQVRSTEESNTYAGLRQQELIEMLDALTGTAERARQEVDRLESSRRELLSENSARQAALQQAEERAESLNVLAGRVPVTGPGIRVTVEETEGRVSVGSLLDMVQELRTAGAEAIEVNNQVRVVAHSSFDGAVGGIELDDQLLEPPYVIEVIGEPHTLHSGLTFASGPIENLEELDGATVEVTELESVDIESIAKPLEPEAAVADPAQ
jgi:uncharacterized protein YlxW (UPF0749 family)